MSRAPRAVRNGEPVQHKRADELTISGDGGRIVQTPGHRGHLRGVDRRDGRISVCTSTGVADYPPDTEFLVWGP